MVHYLRHSEIDFQKWDQCLQQSTNGLIYAYSFYLNVACPGWNALVWNDYEAVMPLPVKKKYGIPYIYTPFFIQQLGVFSPKETSIIHFINAIPRQFKLVEYNLNWANKQLYPELPSWITHHLSLNRPYEEISAQFDRTLKNNLKKADKVPFRLEKNQSIQSVINLFREDKGKELNHLKNQDYKRLENLFEVCEQQQQACVWGVWDGSILVAGALFVWSNKHYIFLFSGNTQRGKETGALPYLLARFIQEHSESDSTFDFEGSNQPGLARFYKSFGSTRVEYPRYERRRFPLF